MDFSFLSLFHDAFAVPVAAGPAASLTLAHALALVGLLWAIMSFMALVERRLVEPLLVQLRMEPGRAFTLGRTIHYAGAFVGFMLGMHLMGIQLSEIAVVFGLLSIGIGFGLQQVTSNFVAGVIIMIERPIKPGDFVTIGDHNGVVLDIHLRATTIVTSDNVKIIVPNSDFIGRHVVNRSFGNELLRLHQPVKLAHGSDPLLVREALLAAAQLPQVLTSPAPDVWLKSFADDALVFELLAWIEEPKDSGPTRSALNFAILRECTARGLVMAYPQRDLHIHGPVPVSVDWAEQRVGAAQEANS